MTNPLGKKIASPDKFSPNILFPISRTDQRLGMTHAFRGKDIWNLHEVQQNWLSQVPIKRLIDPLETASAIVFLSIPASGGIRGVSLAVDGGRLRSI